MFFYSQQNLLKDRNKEDQEKITGFECKATPFNVIKTNPCLILVRLDIFYFKQLKS